MALAVDDERGESPPESSLSVSDSGGGSLMDVHVGTATISPDDHPYTPPTQHFVTLGK